MNQDMVAVKIARYNPETNDKQVQTYQVPRGSKMRILDFLNYIFDELDPSLGYRRHVCNAKMCNGCLIMVNGKPRMVCWEVLPPGQNEVTLEPLRGKKVLKDLVVDFGEGAEAEEE